ncbi:nucleoside recognition domain-containing protein [Acetohalobium arabaticum]|uniref:Ferrous iron transport B domain protein n=1 Tax=Acetohalobium arabaticum (strain ATCC 49924 / DSM 5501 / Z-7288) TaxID=574087 RepID=D9QSA9_ACEAZ|nr:nucleoside recognition domain-containing protein [Acetohalobium arabaticum]ADL11565.1 Ferrous iron transport B domain protein [Acetohalobium arabaticum DSM 5501]
MELSESNQLNSITEKVNRLFNKEEREELSDQMVKDIYTKAERIANRNTKVKEGKTSNWEEKLDRILTSKWTGFPIMLLMLGGVFWITLVGASYPSSILNKALFSVEGVLSDMVMSLGIPEWLHGLLIDGVYRTVAWVIAVMFPPMAIFFPLFTLLEDLGYLPRVAFNLDNFFKKAGAHGKQALTMSMGFGCNAAGVIATRIIDSPREKLIAILTNNFVPCNGRFPTLIILSSLFMTGIAGGMYNSFVAAGIVVGIVLVGIMMTFVVSWGLSKTILKGKPSSFTLELPPFRKPQLGKVLVRSFIDRTLFVLGRAIMVAAPAGIIVWVLANTTINRASLITHLANWLDPFATLLGMDGFILLAFFLGLPANEIVLPVLLMSYLSTGTMLEPGSMESFKNILVNNGWTWVTALSTMLFSLLHFPCGTTLLTIKKETDSLKWTIFAGVLTLGIAVIVTFIVNQMIHIFL